MRVAFPDQPIRPQAPARPARRLAERTLERLDDGTVVALAALGPGDAAVVRAGFARLSPESRYMRFFTAVPRLPESILRRLVDTDGWNHVAIGARTVPPFGARPVEAGVARFHRLPGRPDVAEVAVTVVDELQRRGLGRILLAELSRAARETGVASFVASVLPGNAPMIRLIQRIDPEAKPHLEDGVYRYEIALTPQPSRTAWPRRPHAA